MARPYALTSTIFLFKRFVNHKIVQGDSFVIWGRGLSQRGQVRERSLRKSDLEAIWKLPYLLHKHGVPGKGEQIKKVQVLFVHLH